MRVGRGSMRVGGSCIVAGQKHDVAGQGEECQEITFWADFKVFKISHWGPTDHGLARDTPSSKVV